MAPSEIESVNTPTIFKRIISGADKIDRTLPPMGEFLAPRRRRLKILLMRNGQSAMAREIEACLTRFILSVNCSSKSTTTCVCSIQTGSSLTATALCARPTNCDLLSYSESIGQRTRTSHPFWATQATTEAQLQRTWNQRSRSTKRTSKAKS